MATIENTTPAGLAAQLRGMTDSEIMAQELVQQGGVHAVSFLLANGGTKAMAKRVLQSLQANADLIRAEVQRRGKAPIFPTDQTGDAHA